MPSFRKDLDLALVVPTDEDRLITDHQREAFRKFQDNRSRLLSDAEVGVYEYYQGSLGKIRHQLGDALADRMAPFIDSPASLNVVLTPTEIIVQEDLLKTGKRVVGLLFDCSWNPSLGLAVRFENETIAEIGTQDIVL